MKSDKMLFKAFTVYGSSPEAEQNQCAHGVKLHLRDKQTNGHVCLSVYPFVS